MASKHYKACDELDECNRLIDKYYKEGSYEQCFRGHLNLALKEYPLAECQVGYFYWAGIGVEKDLSKAFLWTRRAAEHGDWDGQFNLGKFYEEGVAVEVDVESAKYWYKKAALQNHDMAIKKCKALDITIDE